MGVTREQRGWDAAFGAGKEEGDKMQKVLLEPDCGEMGKRQQRSPDPVIWAAGSRHHPEQGTTPLSHHRVGCWPPGSVSEGPEPSQPRGTVSRSGWEGSFWSQPCGFKSSCPANQPCEVGQVALHLRGLSLLICKMGTVILIS